MLFCLLLSFRIAQAQTFVGVRGGASYSRVNGIGTTGSSYDWVKSIHGGVFINTNIGESLSLQPEVIYSPRGFTFVKQYEGNKVVNRDTIRYEQDARLNYIDFPVLVRLHGRRYYLEAGPQFSYLLDGRRRDTHTTKNNGVVNQVETEHNLKNIAEPVDLGFIVGLGYQTDFGIGIGLRYNQGFREIIDQQNWQKNVLLQASASYVLGYGGFMKRTNAALQEGAKTNVASARAGKERRRSYRILHKVNVQRVRFVKVGESENPQVEFRFSSVGGHNPDNLIISGSSGTEENGLFTGFRNVQFPYKGSIRFSVPASIGLGSVESYMEFEILEPGIWQIIFLTQ